MNTSQWAIYKKLTDEELSIERLEEELKKPGILLDK